MSNLLVSQYLKPTNASIFVNQHMVADMELMFWINVTVLGVPLYLLQRQLPGFHLPRQLSLNQFMELVQLFLVAFSLETVAEGTNIIFICSLLMRWTDSDLWPYKLEDPTSWSCFKSLQFKPFAFLLQIALKCYIQYFNKNLLTLFVVVDWFWFVNLVPNNKINKSKELAFKDEVLSSQCEDNSNLLVRQQ